MDISHATLDRAKRQLKSEGPFKAVTKRGAPLKFPMELVPELFACVKKKQSKHILPSRSDITEMANKILKNNGINYTLTSKWIDSFLKHDFSPFQQAEAYPMEEERCSVTPQLVNEWFELLTQLDVDSIDPSLLINIDESGYGGTTKNKNEKRIVVVSLDVDVSNLQYAIPRTERHITAVCTITAQRKFLKPILIHSNKTLSYDARQCTFYTNAYYEHTKTAFISTIIYERYFINEIIPYIENRRIELNNPDARAAVIVDGHKSHNTPELLAELARHNIEYIMMPPHTSHLIQPLDRYFFHVAKQAFIHSKPRKDIDQVAATLERIFISLQTAGIQANVLRSWNHARIVPILDESGVSGVRLEINKVINRTSSLFINDNDEEEEDETEKNHTRITTSGSSWGILNEEQVQKMNSGICPFCSQKLP